MKKKWLIFICLSLLVSFTHAGGQQEPTGPVEIEWWHAMGGRLGEKVVTICDGFNASQPNYKVVPVYKGSYAENMTAGIAAFRAGNPPHILQVFEVGTANMMAAKGAIKPVYQLMKETGAPFDPKNYLSTVTGYYTSPEGKMLSLPFNSSTPVLYFNIDAFQKAGLDKEKPPKTWPEVEEYLHKLLKVGYSAGFSTAWISWVHLENLSAWHNTPIGTKANGFEGMDSEYLINGPLQVKHIQQLADWQKDNIFVYGGRRNIGNAKFTTGEVPMYTESSAGYAGFKAGAEFEFGTTMLPYWPDMVDAPQNSIIGGASLWVLEGHLDREYKAVAAFFNYLSSAEVQSDWHQFTGYLPITYAAYKLAREQGVYKENPYMETALKQMTLNDPTENSRGLRFGNFLQMRSVVYDTLEAIFAGKVSAQEGLDSAVEQGNKLLRQFEAANK